jgi:hypothetical protein
MPHDHLKLLLIQIDLKRASSPSSLILFLEVISRVLEHEISTLNSANKIPICLILIVNKLLFFKQAKAFENRDLNDW